MKRLFDLSVGLVGICLCSPLMGLLAVLIKIDSKGPAFYRGERVGLYGMPFKIFKFRTMIVNAEKLGGPSTSGTDPRVTKVGRFLRKYKLDELPQFINVLKGEMSLVGPRPEVKKYTDLYSETERRILTVRPGITDWASLENSDEGATLAKYNDPDKAYEDIIRPKKLRLQLKYVEERSFLNDIFILFRTIKTVVAK